MGVALVGCGGTADVDLKGAAGFGPGDAGRSRSSRVVVAASCGPVVGYTSATAALPFGLSTGGTTPATPCSYRVEVVNAAKRARSAGLSIWPTSTRGPLKPGPNPELTVAASAEPAFWMWPSRCRPRQFAVRPVLERCFCLLSVAVEGDGGSGGLALTG